MAAFYEFFNEQKYADAVKNVSVDINKMVRQPPCPVLFRRNHCYFRKLS